MCIRDRYSTAPLRIISGSINVFFNLAQENEKFKMMAIEAMIRKMLNITNMDFRLLLFLIIWK